MSVALEMLWWASREESKTSDVYLEITSLPFLGFVCFPQNTLLIELLTAVESSSELFFKRESGGRASGACRHGSGVNLYESSQNKKQKIYNTIMVPS